MANRTYTLGVWERNSSPQKAPYTENSRILRHGDAQSTSFCVTQVPSHCRGVHSNPRGTWLPQPQLAPGFQSNGASRSCSLPLCKGTFDIQRVPHTISTELTIIVIGSCHEIRSQEAEKRNQRFVGLIRIRRVTRLLKKKEQQQQKKKSLKGRTKACT